MKNLMEIFGQSYPTTVAYICTEEYKVQSIEFLRVYNKVLVYAWKRCASIVECQLFASGGANRLN